jgi:hypothetical protein
MQLALPSTIEPAVAPPVPSPALQRTPRPPSPRKSLGLVRRAQVACSAAAALTPLPVAALTVGADDDMATLHARLERAANRRLTLAIAPEARVLQRPLDYRVLRRLAEELSLDVSIATDDGHRRRLAREFGFAVEAPRGARRAWRPRARQIGSGVATLGLLAASLVGLPRTQITLDPSAAPLTRQATVTVDLRPGAPGVGEGWVASKTLMTTFEIEQTVPATGSQSVGQTPAAGYVTFQDLRPYLPPPPPVPAPAPAAVANAAAGMAGVIPIQLPPAEVLPPAPTPLPERVIPAGTAVATADGQRYFTRTEARLTPSGYVQVPIVAEFVGRAGNVPPGAIDRLADPKADARDLRVENRLATYGGTDRQERVVAADDRAKLRQALEDRAATEAPARLFNEAGTDFVVVPDSATWSVEPQFDYAADQRATQLTGRATVRARALGVPNRALEESASRAWRAQVPEGLEAIGKPQVAGAPAIEERADDYLVVSLPVQGKVAPQLDVGLLAEQLRGQPADAIRARVASLPGLSTKPRVETWPAWAPAALRVDVVVASPR